MPSLARRRRLWRLAILMALSAVVGCAHSTELSSSPPGATVYLDGEKVGETPLSVELATGLFETHVVRLEHEDRLPLELKLRQSDPNWAALVPGLVCAGPTCGLSLLALLLGTRFGDAYAFTLEKREVGPHERAAVEDESHAVHY